jgi:hypothetical protein
MLVLRHCDHVSRKHGRVVQLRPDSNVSVCTPSRLNGGDRGLAKVVRSYPEDETERRPFRDAGALIDAMFRARPASVVPSSALSSRFIPSQDAGTRRAERSSAKRSIRTARNRLPATMVRFGALSSSIVRNAATALASFPLPVDDTVENLEPREQIYERFGLPTPSDQIAATLQARCFFFGAWTTTRWGVVAEGFRSAPAKPLLRG